MNALNNEVFDSFYAINKAIFRLVKSDADRIGVTVVQLKVLHHISTCPNIGLGELAEHLRLTNSTVSGVIDRLVHNGLIDRVTSPQDRRAISLQLTERGKKKLDELIQSSVFVEKINKIMQLPKEDTQRLLQMHKTILEVLMIKED
ncbi:MarR family winged helix-turn-helix transcriptional regulator [Heyndrickxia acidicola]|uniref:MarR family transcriptional regulator n=1 Tax=Heyndrickxia acidicola TaxID=209389 RepID=A0ABU6MLZ0_9BACI|nr:MarR family transcriptional regulator [Heyndrickxia acidicola]MED1205696.1 MarR family transcriptional regulator [Heyndrickxia acidicola]